MKAILVAGGSLLFALLPAGGAVEFEKEVWPILKSNCIKCHRDGKEKGELNLEPHKIANHIGSGRIIQPGKANGSLLMKVILSEEPDTRMPPKGSRLSEREVNTLKLWIAQGAEIPEPDPDAPKPLSGVWTNQDGKELTATLVKVEDGKAMLKLKNGKVVPYPIEKLSEASQKVVREWAEGGEEDTP